MFYSYTPYRRHIFILYGSVLLWYCIIWVRCVCVGLTIHYFSYYSRPKKDTRLFTTPSPYSLLFSYPPSLSSSPFLSFIFIFLITSSALLLSIFLSFLLLFASLWIAETRKRFSPFSLAAVSSATFFAIISFSTAQNYAFRASSIRRRFLTHSTN